VKNNLQIVQSLIRLKVRQGDGSVAEQIIQRVGAVSDVHDLLYASGVQGQINFRDFLVRIAANESLFPPERRVRPDCDLADLVIDTEQATPLALVVVELVTNAVKHAFPDQRAGTVTIRLRKEGETAVLEIADDGIGLRDNGRASGIRLVRAFVDQLGGQLTRETGETGGTRWRLAFPVQRTAPAAADPAGGAHARPANAGGEVSPAT
jgi:two-component sensor histidine kinase